MQELLWVLQGNLGGGGDVEKLMASLTSLGIAYKTIDIIPFSDDYPDVTWDGPVIAYGSTRFVTNVHNKGRWNPGVFFDHASFTMLACMEHYGEHMLNASAKLTTISDFSRHDFPPDTEIFVRPQRDLKEFEAKLYRAGDIASWFEVICNGDFELAPDTPILVAEPVQIHREWRMFMVNERYCSGSLYMENGALNIDAEVPGEVINFANKMAAIWSPSSAYVMDIADVDEQLKIIEINCFNSSGFYASDIEKILDDVSRMYRHES